MFRMLRLVNALHLYMNNREDQEAHQGLFQTFKRFPIVILFSLILQTLREIL